MRKQIEWFEDDGCLGGQRGLNFNLETNIITNWDGIEEKLSEHNIEDVRWCIKMNIKYLNDKFNDIQLKLNQKETKHIKIDNGYKISKPLNDEQYLRYQTYLQIILTELQWLNSIVLQL